MQNLVRLIELCIKHDAILEISGGIVGVVEMKIRIKTYNGELPDYLTVGKVYPLDAIDDFYGGDIINDDCKKSFIQINECHHLNGGSWEMCDE